MAQGAVAAVEGIAAISMLTGGNAGPLLRATQILKMYNRLKYVGVNFGDRLDKLLVYIGRIFSDSVTDNASVERIKLMERGTVGKITRFYVIASIFKGIGWKLFAYIASFLG